MSRRASKLWPRPAASASAGWCAIRCATGLIALSKTRASSRSRTYPASAGVCAKPGSSRRSAGTERSTRHATVAVPSAARLSIVVLPITNLSNDRGQQYFELGGALCTGGSVRRMGSHVRANAQLIDAATDAHLWAERFDGEADD